MGVLPDPVLALGGAGGRVPHLFLQWVGSLGGYEAARVPETLVVVLLHRAAGRLALLRPPLLLIA